MHSTSAFVLSAIGLFAGMMACLELGRRAGQRWGRVVGEEGGKGIGTVEGAVFALFGLLLAFTFSGATSRFEHRRELVVQEANAIGTAYLRIDLLPTESQPALRGLFRQYVQARLAGFQHIADPVAFQQDYRRAVDLQGQIWRLAVACVQASPSPPMAAQLLPALNDMIDITTTRAAALQTHPPQIIFVMLYGLGLLVSLLAGYGMADSKTRPWLHVITFASAVTATIYVTLDIEYPRFGLIRVDAVDRVLAEVLESME